MKKILILALTAVMLFCLTACGGNNETTMPEDTTPQTGRTSDDMPTVDRNVPDPKVNDNSTDNGDSAGNNGDASGNNGNTSGNNRDASGSSNNQNGILDDAMDRITGQK